MSVVSKPLGIAIGIGVALLACQWSGAASAAPTTLDQLKAAVQGKSLTLGFGSTPNLAEVQSVQVATILHDQFGVNVTYKPLPADVEAAAVISGSVDAGEVSLSRLAGLKQGGADPLVFETNDYKNDDVLVAKAPITTMAQLKGKVYGDAGGTGLGPFLRNGCFNGSGIAISDVTLVQLATSGAVAQAAATPQLDAALIHADAAATLQAKFPGMYNVLCLAYQKVSVANDVWYSTRSWVTKNPDMTLAITVAEIEAARGVYSDRASWLKAAAAYVPGLPAGVPEATYDLYAGKIQMWDVNGALDLKDCWYQHRPAAAGEGPAGLGGLLDIPDAGLPDPGACPGRSGNAAGGQVRGGETVHYLRLYADEAGESHFEEIELPTKRLKSPVSPAVFAATDPLPVRGAAFRRVVEEVPDGQPHCAPRRQLIVHLAGEVEIVTSDGERRVMGPGSVVLAEDLTGRGHVTRTLSGGPRAYLQIPLDEP